MRSKRSLEGEIWVDHRESPGISPQQAAGGWLSVAGGQQYESAVYTCGHCRMLLLSDPLRTISHEWCAGCDHYLCYRCMALRHRTLRCDSAAARRDRFLATGRI